MREYAGMTPAAIGKLTWAQMLALYAETPDKGAVSRELSGGEAAQIAANYQHTRGTWLVDAAWGI